MDSVTDLGVIRQNNYSGNNYSPVGGEKHVWTDYNGNRCEYIEEYDYDYYKQTGYKIRP